MLLKNTEHTSKFAFTHSPTAEWLVSNMVSNHLPTVVDVIFCLVWTQSYSREIPSRFKKDIIRAAKQDEVETEHILLEGLQQLVANIKMEHKVSRNDIQTIFYELGDSSGKIQADRMMSML